MKNKKLDNNTIRAFWVALGSLSNFGFSIIGAIILSRYFSKVDYGTYKQIIFIYTSLLVVFSAGLPSVFGYYLPRYSLNQGKDIVIKITKILFVLGIFFSLFLFVFSDLMGVILNNPDLSKTLKYFSPIPMLLLPTLGIEGIFSTYGKTYYIAIFDFITRIITLIFVLTPVVFFNGTMLDCIIGWVFGCSLQFIIALFFKKIPFIRVETEKSNLPFREIFKYSLPILTASFWGILIVSSYQFYISRYFGTEVFADFSNGFIELPIVTMITSSSAVVLLPVFSKMVNEKNNMDDLISLWKRTLIKSASLIYPIIVFFIFNSDSVIKILYSEKYMNSSIYFVIAMCVNFFNIILFSPLLFSLGKTRFYSNLHMFIAFLAWVLGYVIVQIFNSPIYIAMLVAILTILKLLIFFIYISKLLKTPILKLLPIVGFVKYFVHSIIAIYISKGIITNLFISLNDIVHVLLVFILYTSILLLTARFFRVNYLIAITPLLKKININ